MPDNEDVEVLVIRKDEVEDMMRQVLEQISVLRDKIEEIENRLGENVNSNAGEEENNEENVDTGTEEEEQEEEKGVAPEGEGGSKKEKERMDVNEQNPKPTPDTGETKTEADAIKGELVKVVREEIKKAIGDIVTTPKPELGNEVTVKKEDNEIRKGIRDILEGKAHARDVVRKIAGGE